MGAVSKVLNRLRPRARTGAEPRAALSEDQVRQVWLCASWLIGYPDDELFEHLALVEELAGGLPEAVATELLEVVAQLRGEVQEVRADYVETFDTRRRGCLYLTYFSNGDTRRRGMALLKIKEIYRDAGLEVSDAELPDHLSYVLEFGAAHGLERARAILLTHRAGVELLRLHLTEIESRWAGVLRVVCATLPALAGDDIEAVQRLAAQGAPEELVGIGEAADGSADMPPADLSPYQLTPAPAPGKPVFVSLDEVKGLRS